MADRAAAILADAVGRHDEAEMFRARSFNYRNNWCEKEGRFLPRKANGFFVPRSQLAKPYRDYCEQSPETATWTVPYDISIRFSGCLNAETSPFMEISLHTIRPISTTASAHLKRPSGA